jgi:Tfp pilus assembly protein PilZ
MTTKERRRYVRVARLRFVEFVVGGRTYHGTIENKGDGGVFIKTKEHFYAGQDISMTYESSIFLREERKGTMVWVGPQGVGVEFNCPENDR